MARLRILLLSLLALMASVAFAAPPQVGDPAPTFSLKTIDGKVLALEDLRGKLVVLHFAATWCPFCAAEAPHLEKLYREYRERGVEVCIIDIKEPAPLVAKNARKLGLSFPVLLDTEGEVAQRFAPPSAVQPDLARDEVMIASNLVVDREGRIRFFSLLDSANFDAKLVTLRARLDQLLDPK